MSFSRASAHIAWVVPIALGGCAAVGHFDPTPSHPVDFSGSWVIDPVASEDPKPILAKLRPKPGSRGATLPDPTAIDDQAEQTTGPPSGQRGGGRGGRGGQSQNSQYTNIPRVNDAYRRIPVLQMLTADVARSDHVTIRQSPERFSIDYGSSVRSFTPGAVSVVSAEWGVADQSSGFNGKDYVIRVKPQSGVASIETFSLSSDGQRLTEHLRLGGGDYVSAELTRVYNRTDQALPRAAPTNDLAQARRADGMRACSAHADWTARDACQPPAICWVCD